jgi:hypothetical protein
MTQNTWRRLSNLRVHGIRKPTFGFQSRVSVLELVTRKSPEPADRNVCATSIFRHRFKIALQNRA